MVSESFYFELGRLICAMFISFSLNFYLELTLLLAAEEGLYFGRCMLFDLYLPLAF